MAAGGGRVFVGRAHELAELRRAMQTARAGRGAIALLVGDAGIGKTRLVSELAELAQGAGFAVLIGHAIDLAGTELPYHPFAEALRPLGQPWMDAGRTPGSQLLLFENALSLLVDRAESAPVLLILEDLHWADASTLDLVRYLAHNIDGRPIMMALTARADELGAIDRVRALANAMRRTAAAQVINVARLDDATIAQLLEASAATRISASVADTIVSRAQGNPFFAEELLTVAGGDERELPVSLRDLLLYRTATLDRTTFDLLRAAATSGREVTYATLCATAGYPESEVREALRRAVERGILVADDSGTGNVRFRHSLLAEAVYATVLPGEREELHARMAAHLTGVRDASPAECARHWAAAGRPVEALAASVEAARRAERMSGLAEALAHLERVIELWDRVPTAAEMSGLDLAAVCAWAAGLAFHVGAAQRAVQLARRAIDLTGSDRLHRLAGLHVQLGEYLYGIGKQDAALAALERAVALVPTEPPSPERAWAAASLAGGLMVAWRSAESLPLAREALDIACATGAGEAEVRARTVIGIDLARSGYPEEGLVELRHAMRQAEEIGDLVGVDRAYVNLTDTLFWLGRVRESSRVAASGLTWMRGHGITDQVLTANRLEALLACGEWEAAAQVGADAIRSVADSFSYVIHIHWAALETGRGDAEAARTHLDAALSTLPADHDQGTYEAHLAELALWERRWTDAVHAVDEALARATSPETAQLRVWFCAKGLRALAELAALGRARRDKEAARTWTDRGARLLADARNAADDASRVTPHANAWLLTAEAEHCRLLGGTHAAPWTEAASAWDRLERRPLAAYCRWREAEALLTSGAAREDAARPLRSAYADATRMGAAPLVLELEALARRGRLRMRVPHQSRSKGSELAEALGLTPREAEVLSLVAQGLTNREIAHTLVISEKTTGVHVTHILRKLNVPTRLDAAALASVASGTGLQLLVTKKPDP